MNWSCPSLWLCALWLLWLLQALFGWHNVYKFRRLVRVQGVRSEGSEVDFTPPATVIVPVKGADDQFAGHLEALLSQAYPKYRVILVVESADDPAHDVIAARLAHHQGVPAQLLVAGPAEDCGQKVWNLLAACRTLSEDDEAIVFADADAVPDTQWLGRMTAPLYKQYVGVTTGYRWMVPADDHPASQVASVLNASVATLAGPRRRNQVWGGSMAILRKTMLELGVERMWQGALSDDYQMTRAVRKSGLRVYFIPRCLVCSPVRYTWRSLLHFARRQFLITRIHSPWLWLAAALCPMLYLAGWISALAALVGGVVWAIPVMAGVYAMDYKRGEMRRQVVREALGAEVESQLARPLWLDRFATPLWLAVQLVLVLSSAAGRKIHWAGFVYRMRSPQRVTILQRRPLEPPPPGTPGITKP